LSADGAGEPRQSFLLAVGAIVAAIFLFDVQGAIIKHLSDRYPVPQLAVFRNLFGLLPNIAALLWSQQWIAQGRPLLLVQWRLALGRGVILVVAQICFYYAIGNMELATATTLAFAGPLFVTTLSVPMLGHKIGIWRIGAVVIGFVGVIMVMQPGQSFFTPIAILPITAAFFYALTSLTARYFDSSVPTAQINLYSGVGTLFASALVASLATDWLQVSQTTDWLWLLAMGTAGGFAVLLMITAYRMTAPSNLSPFEYLGIPFSFMLGWIFFAETPFDRLFPGVFLIVGAGLLVIARERHLRKLADRKKALEDTPSETMS